MKRQSTEDTAGGSQAGDFTCPDCGGDCTITVLHDDAFEYGSGHASVTLHAFVPVHCCSQCGFEYLGREGRLIKHESVCRHLGLLTPTVIRHIRERYKMRRGSFAGILGLSEESLIRWENGAPIQNTAYDNYLRLLQSPEDLLRLNDHGSSEHDPRSVTLPDGSKS